MKTIFTQIKQRRRIKLKLSAVELTSHRMMFEFESIEREVIESRGANARNDANVKKSTFQLKTVRNTPRTECTVLSLSHCFVQSLSDRENTRTYTQTHNLHMHLCQRNALVPKHLTDRLIVCMHDRATMCVNDTLTPKCQSTTNFL